MIRVLGYLVLLGVGFTGCNGGQTDPEDTKAEPDLVNAGLDARDTLQAEIDDASSDAGEETSWLKASGVFLGSSFSMSCDSLSTSMAADSHAVPISGGWTVTCATGDEHHIKVNIQFRPSAALETRLDLVTAGADGKMTVLRTGPSAQGFRSEDAAEAWLEATGSFHHLTASFAGRWGTPDHPAGHVEINGSMQLTSGD